MAEESCWHAFMAAAETCGERAQAACGDVARGGEDVPAVLIPEMWSPDLAGSGARPHLNRGVAIGPGGDCGAKVGTTRVGEATRTNSRKPFETGTGLPCGGEWADSLPSPGGRGGRGPPGERSPATTTGDLTPSGAASCADPLWGGEPIAWTVLLATDTHPADPTCAEPLACDGDMATWWHESFGEPTPWPTLTIMLPVLGEWAAGGDSLPRDLCGVPWSGVWDMG